MTEAARHLPLAAFVVAFVATLLAAPLAAAPRRGEDPDWPCPQRLVPTLSAATFWSGPALDAAGEWQEDPEVAALVRRITPRRVSAEDGEAAIAAFADAIERGHDRSRRLLLVVAGLLDETNRERAALLARIKELGRRQNELAEIASSAGAELRNIPADAGGDQAVRRSDLEQRFAFVTRAFEGAQRTLRYACEAPVSLEARLGRYARAVQERL
jgi:hypothetical protein